GYPLDRIEKGDPYQRHALETVRLLEEELGDALPERRELCYQSRFGPRTWLSPSTAGVLLALPNQGIRRVCVAFPSFAADCLETLHEVGIGLRARFIKAGGEHLALVPCLNGNALWSRNLAEGLLLPDLAELMIQGAGVRRAGETRGGEI
ncbi:MAG: ferrochelatase, partial [Planctomycetes bacterium]|nr:ferrochelatase [Planctomycetota bacterium]